MSTCIIPSTRGWFILFWASYVCHTCIKSKAFSFQVQPKTLRNTSWNLDLNRKSSSIPFLPITIISSPLSTRPLSHSYTLQNRVQSSSSSSSLCMIFDKLFEEEGPLGKGITVGKVQVALSLPPSGGGKDRTSILTSLTECTQDVDDSNEELSQMAHEVCLLLLRNEDKWIGACSDSTWFSERDGGKAESTYNEWVQKEDLKFEKVYTPDSTSQSSSSSAGTAISSTLAVVSIIVEIQGDSVEFKGAGKNIASTKSILSDLASSVLVDDGYCLNAVEILWTPSEVNEVLTKKDIIIDFPEIVDF